MARHFARADMPRHVTRWNGSCIALHRSTQSASSREHAVNVHVILHVMRGFLTAAKGESDGTVVPAPLLRASAPITCISTAVSVGGRTPCGRTTHRLFKWCSTKLRNTPSVHIVAGSEVQTPQRAHIVESSAGVPLLNSCDRRTIGHLRHATSSCAGKHNQYP